MQRKGGINHVKRNPGLLIAFGAMLGGAVAAGISYYLKLKSFNDELDQDFHEYEEEETLLRETEEKTEPAPENLYYDQFRKRHKRCG